jgi:hypothetical protein
VETGLGDDELSSVKLESETSAFADERESCVEFCDIEILRQVGEPIVGLIVEVVDSHFHLFPGTPCSAGGVQYLDGLALKNRQVH